MPAQNDHEGDYPSHPAIYIVWLRSRTRALAHQFASDRLRAGANKSYLWEMTVNIIGLALLVAGLSVSDVGLVKPVVEVFHYDKASAYLEIFGKNLIILSALTSILALWLAVISELTPAAACRGRGSACRSPCTDRQKHDGRLRSDRSSRAPAAARCRSRSAHGTPRRPGCCGLCRWATSTSS